MKKSLLVVVLALALVMAFGATTAFAKYAGFMADPVYVPWTTANSMASQNPAAATQAFGPHAGYATTTIKCAVCHSVHRGSNKILNKGNNACSYCHTPLCESGGAVASALISWTGAGPHSSCASSYCHASAHGVGVSVYAAPASKLLVKAADTELVTLNAANTAVGMATQAPFGTWTANTRVLATGAVCGRDGCHADSLFGVVAAGATRDVEVSGGGRPAPRETNVTAHRVIAAVTTDWNANPVGAYSPASFTGQIAYAAVTYCDSCHDLVDNCNSNLTAFPHSIDGIVDTAAGFDGTWRAAVWLTAGGYVGDPNRAAVSTYDDYAANSRTSAYGTATQKLISGAAGSSVLDGTCLKCHRNQTSGVGLTY